ncbi:MAG: bifunctional diaminohydroxyphosphoribosylaminopyrimidine deaminase/5-amino-6-(5-phosphoribosylamino)uracil reductase RibD [Deltaproteobacteria bacterium]|nr:bifunctional diaminohydroxyphosphoribosylaminopyrimidine deaminase/5-amino-6-(5-phosphoribosylamino)uracil reductase RibD [Deltaproteobacteria bacterium]
MNDQAYMKLALRLAAKGAGWVSPNPMVGAVVVKDGQIVGRGYHRAYGLPHAEVEALIRAGAASRGADLYVTLEPCNHQGRTPPCTHAVLNAGIRRVVIATRDPNPRVNGGGAEFLQSQGLQVEMGLLADQARRLNEAWFKWVETGLPFVIAKAACSLDGKIATTSGESQWLTGEKARAYGHQLRHRVDTILVGVGTVLADDPQLTVRLGGRRRVGQGGFSNNQTENRKPKTENRFKDPIRIVLDSRLRLPLSARLLHLDSPAPTWVACTAAAPKDNIQALKDLGAEVLVMPPEPSGLVALKPLLAELGRRQVQSLLVEGGAETLGSFFDQRLVDKFYFFYAPKILGGKSAPGMLAGAGVKHLGNALQARDMRVRKLGPDLLVSGYL